MQAFRQQGLIAVYETFNRSHLYIKPPPSSFQLYFHSQFVFPLTVHLTSKSTFIPSSQFLTMSFIRSNLFKATASPLRRSAFATTPLRAFTRSALVSNKKDDGYEEHRVEVEPKIAAVDESITFEHPEVGFSIHAIHVCRRNPNIWLGSPSQPMFLCSKGSHNQMCFFLHLC